MVGLCGVVEGQDGRNECIDLHSSMVYCCVLDAIFVVLALILYLWMIQCTCGRRRGCDAEGWGEGISVIKWSCFRLGRWGVKFKFQHVMIFLCLTKDGNGTFSVRHCALLDGGQFW